MTGHVLTTRERLLSLQQSAWRAMNDIARISYQLRFFAIILCQNCRELPVRANCKYSNCWSKVKVDNQTLIIYTVILLPPL